MGFKIWCQDGGGGTLLSKSPFVREFLNIWFCNFFFVFIEFILFFENYENVFAIENWKKYVSILIYYFCFLVNSSDFVT